MVGWQKSTISFQIILGVFSDPEKKHVDEFLYHQKKISVAFVLRNKQHSHQDNHNVLFRLKKQDGLGEVSVMRRCS